MSSRFSCNCLFSCPIDCALNYCSHLRDIKEDILHCEKLVQQLQESIETRFSGIVRRLNQSDVIENDHYGDPLYSMTAVLNPMFKFFF